MKNKIMAAQDSGIDARDLIPPPTGEKIFVPMGSELRMVPIQSERTSTMRAMAMISLIVGAGIAFVGLYRCEDLTSLAVLCGVFVAPAFAGKAVQKHIEVKGKKSE